MAFQVEKALKHRVVLLAGSEQELCSRALKQLIEAASGDSDFDLEEFDAGSSEPVSWFSSAGTAPFLGERRTAVVRHVLRIDLDKKTAKELKEQVQRQLEALPASAFVILVGDEEAGDDSKQQDLKKAQTSWERVVSKAGGCVELFTFDSKAIPGQVRIEAQALGKKISEKAVMTLVEMTGSSFSRAVEELQKLAIFVGDAVEIRESDVREVATPSREWKVFSLVDSVTSGQPAEALRQLRTLVGSQNKAEDAALRVGLQLVADNVEVLGGRFHEAHAFT